MKKILFIAIICLGTKNLPAQLNTNLSLVTMPPGTLMDWNNKTLTYLVSSAAGITARVVIKTEIKTTTGAVVGTTNLAKARIFTAGAGNLILYPADVLPLEIMMFSGKYKTSLERSGKLPADNYELCVQLVTPIDFRPVSELRCRNFNIAAFQLPIPMMPASESLLELEKAQSVITFRWTPVAPRPAEVLTYRVTVFEILENQTPLQALRSNQPLLAQDIKGTTQFLWQPQLGLTRCCPGANTGGNEKTKKDTIKTPGPGMDPVIDAYAFIWTLQTFDSQGRPFGDGNVNGDGLSEPTIFFIDRRSPAMQRSGPPSRVISLSKIQGKRN